MMTNPMEYKVVTSDPLGDEKDFSKEINKLAKAGWIITHFSTDVNPYEHSNKTCELLFSVLMVREKEQKDTK